MLTSTLLEVKNAREYSVSYLERITRTTHSNEWGKRLRAYLEHCIKTGIFPSKNHFFFDGKKINPYTPQSVFQHLKAQCGENPTIFEIVDVEGEPPHDVWYTLRAV